MIDENIAAKAGETTDVAKYLYALSHDNAALLEALAGVLKSAIPYKTRIRRYWLGWTIREIIVNFQSVGFQISCTRASIPTIERATIVDGVAIDHKTITMTELLEELNTQLQQEAAENASIHTALTSFMLGAQPR